MPFVTTPDGCRIYYETHGFGTHGPVLVFINGTAQTTLNWLSMAMRLKNRFQVLIHDSRCQGESDIGSILPDVTTHAQDVVALLDHLGIQRVHLVGLSRGGRIALEVAARHPERVERVVCIATTMGRSPRRESLVTSWIEVLRAGGVPALGWAMVPFVFGETFLKKHQRFLGAAVQALAQRNRPEALLAYLSAMAADTGHPTPGPLRCPTLFLAGSDDPIAPVSRVAETANAFGGTHQVIDGVGHSIPVEAPEAFEAILLHQTNGGQVAV